MNVSMAVFFRRALIRPSNCAHFSSLWLVNPRPKSIVKHDVIMTTTIASPFGTRRNRNNEIEIPEKQLHIAFIRASGPGGQNVNKVSTAVEIRFHVASADWVGSVEARERLVEQQRGKVNSKGELVMTSQEHRTQHQNRHECLGKLREVVAAARIEPKEREQYEGLSDKGKGHRRQEKRRRSVVKENRRSKTDW